MNKSDYLLWRTISNAIKSTSFLASIICALYGLHHIAGLLVIPIIGSWYLLDYVSGKYIEELEKGITKVARIAMFGVDFGGNREQ